MNPDFARGLVAHAGSGRWISWEEIAFCAPEHGLILEFGVFEGNSLNRLSLLFPNRKVYGFDWFKGLPTDWRGDDKGMFSTNGKPPIVPHNAELVVGLVEDTLLKFLTEHQEPIALVHFDLDLYEPTSFVLNRLNFQAGSVLLFDEIINHEINIEHEGRALREFEAEGRFKVNWLGQYAQEAAAYFLS